MGVSTITLERTTVAIGARVSGFQIHAEQPSSDTDELKRALHEYGVLFFDLGDSVEDSEHKQLGRIFGEVLPLPLQNGGDPDFITFDSETPTRYTADFWHTDGTHEECPAGVALLRCVVLPTLGGDTLWASMYAAYEALSSHYQRILDGLEAEHAMDPGSRVLTTGDKAPCTHPVVVRDAVTGRSALYVNSLYTKRIVGMTDTESNRLLSMLFDHVNTPDFHVRLRWEQGVVAVWEERITQHRAIADFLGRRVMRRLQLVGQRPSA